MKPLLFDKFMVKHRELMHKGVPLDRPVPFVLDTLSLAAAANLAQDAADILLEACVIPYPATWLEFTFKGFTIGALTNIKAPNLIGISIVEEQDKQAYNPITFLLSPTQKYELDCGYINIANAANVIEKIDPVTNLLWKTQAFAIPPSKELPAWAPYACVGLFDRGDRKMDWEIAEIYLRQRPSVLPLILGGLAIIAYGSARKTVMTPSGRWLDRSRHGIRPRPYAVHTVVSVETSPRLLYKSIRNAVSEIHRREHDVRAHPRIIRRGRPDQYTVIVRSHKRGDPAIGKVIHDGYSADWIDRK